MTLRALTLFCLTVAACGSGGASWAHIFPLTPTKDARFKIQATINGHTLDCLFDSGADTADHAIWLQDAAAERLGIPVEVKEDGYHRYRNLTVSVFEYERQDVTAYQYPASWDAEDECLLGPNFFLYPVIEIDRAANEVRVK